MTDGLFTLAMGQSEIMDGLPAPDVSLPDAACQFL